MAQRPVRHAQALAGGTHHPWVGLEQSEQEQRQALQPSAAEGRKLEAVAPLLEQLEMGNAEVHVSLEGSRMLEAQVVESRMSPSARAVSAQKIVEPQLETAVQPESESCMLTREWSGSLTYQVVAQEHMVLWQSGIAAASEAHQGHQS